MKCNSCNSIRTRKRYPSISWEYGYCSKCWAQKLLFVDDAKLEDIRLTTNPVDAYWHNATLKELSR